MTEVTRQYALIAGTPAEWLKRAILREVHLQDPPSLRKRKKYFHTEDEEGAEPRHGTRDGGRCPSEDRVSLHLVLCLSEALTLEEMELLLPLVTM